MAVRVVLSPVSGDESFVIPIVSDRARRVADEARRRAPRRSGKLASSITARTTLRAGAAIGVVEAGAPHARWVHEGTGIYGPRRQMIRPRSARMLSWIDAGAGRRVFAHAVRGQPPRPYLTDALSALGLRGVRR